jgi:hypothetical protein
MMSLARRSLSRFRPAEFGVALAACSLACGTILAASPPASEPSLVARAKEFRSLLERRDYDAARRLMAPDPREWWEKRDGEGRPWTIGPGAGGPWAAWDDQFRSTKEVLRWEPADRSATTVIRETNDYFRLLERGFVTSELTYFFDEAGRIEGLLIRAAGERPPGRTDEFLAWAKAHEAAELQTLMPGGEIDPSADHPERFRRLLVRWRKEAGLPPIE